MKFTLINSTSLPGRDPIQVEYEAYGELNYEGDWESHVYITRVWVKTVDKAGVNRVVDINEHRLLKEWFIDELREKGEAYITQQELDDDLWDEWCKEIRSRTRKHS